MQAPQAEADDRTMGTTDGSGGVVTSQLVVLVVAVAGGTAQGGNDSSGDGVVPLSMHRDDKLDVEDLGEITYWPLIKVVVEERNLFVGTRRVSGRSDNALSLLMLSLPFARFVLAGADDSSKEWT
jgi:hypothetical protein